MLPLQRSPSNDLRICVYPFTAVRSHLVTPKDTLARTEFILSTCPIEETLDKSIADNTR